MGCQPQTEHTYLVLRQFSNKGTTVKTEAADLPKHTIRHFRRMTSLYLRNKLEILQKLRYAVEYRHKVVRFRGRVKIFGIRRTFDPPLRPTQPPKQ